MLKVPWPEQEGASAPTGDGASSAIQATQTHRITRWLAEEICRAMRIRNEKKRRAESRRDIHLLAPCISLIDRVTGGNHSNYFS